MNFYFFEFLRGPFFPLKIHHSNIYIQLYKWNTEGQWIFTPFFQKKPKERKRNRLKGVSEKDFINFIYSIGSILKAFS